MNRWFCGVLFAFISQVCFSQIHSSQKITARQLKREIDSKFPLYVINVLNRNSFKDCSIPGSVNIPIDRLHRCGKKWKMDKPIVVHCASFDCPLSEYGYDLLVKQGFTNVREFAGGSREWYQRGYPVRGVARAGYLQK